jgi:intein/homing endonuclease
MNKNEQIKFIEENFPATTHHISNRRVRHSIFTNIQTELQAYLLGFYTADGSIDEKRKTFRIELQKGDCEIVYLFKDIISPDARLYSTKERTFIGPRGKEIHAHGNIGIDITSAELCNSLVKLNIGYRKSYNELHIPNIPTNLIRHFIRGYFDGDGCICGYIKHNKSRNSDSFVKQFDFTSKTVSLLTDIQKFFAEHDIKINLNYQKRDNLYRLRTCSKKEVVKIFDLLYSNSNFYLSRKFNKFNHYVNTEVTQLIAEYRNA